MATTADIKNGFCMEYSHDIYKVVEFLHVKPGKGPAFVRTKLKSLTNGKVVDNTFPSGHKLVEVRIERRKFQFLYKDDMGYHFMDNESYEQTSMEAKLIDHPGLLKEGENVDILFHSEKNIPLVMELPQFIQMKVTYTEPGLRGDTATNVTKPATLESGMEVKVPIFINEGDILKIDTRTASYVERVKK